MGKFDEINPMKRMMGLKGKSKKGQERQHYNQTHKKLSDEDVAGIEGQLGNRMDERDVRRRRRGQRVDSIFGSVRDAMLGGGG